MGACVFQPSLSPTPDSSKEQDPPQILRTQTSFHQKMSVAVMCEMCSAVYQTESCDPVLLPCGHTFCRTCVAGVQRKGDLSCPTCSRDISHLDVKDLLVNFQVLNLSRNYNKLQQDSCRDHGDELKYWCRDCESSLCSLCLYTDHPQGHRVLLARTFLEERKHSLKDQAMYIDRTVKETTHDFHSNLRQCFQKIKILTQVQADVLGILNDLQKSCSIKSVLNLEEKMKALQDKGLSSLTNGGIKVLNGGDDGQTAVGIEEGKTEVAKDLIMQQQKAPPVAHQTVNSQRVKLDCRDGRLLLHSLAQHVDTHLSMQLPSEVFLELSAGGRCLGRVYIQLWSHLRRAHQFLALCLGTLGPSHVGASFKSVSDMDKERETIWCTEYCSPGGGTGYRALMLDMEWDGEYGSEPRQGLVVAYSNDVNNYGFGICTRGKPGANFSSPFGQVSSGLEVVQSAVRHDPVTEITITDCGLVIPDLTQPITS